MAGKVFFSVSMSLDGFIAPESLGELMGQQWMELQQWVFPQRFFRENLGLGEGGEEGRDNDILRDTFDRTGSSVMGKRMFDAGEKMWPEEAPFHTPVFVVTHEKRDSWERPGGTTFHFVNDGIQSALDRAREAAGDRDVRIAGGGETILEHLNAGLIDEFSIALSPVLFGSGIRLFEGVDAGRVALEPRAPPPGPRGLRGWGSGRRGEGDEAAVGNRGGGGAAVLDRDRAVALAPDDQGRHVAEQIEAIDGADALPVDVDHRSEGLGGRRAAIPAPAEGPSARATACR